MELRPGYKQTEVGVIPEEWEPYRLKDLADIQRGASPRPIDSAVWYDSTSNVGWVRISDVTASDGKHLRVTTNYFSKRGAANSRYLPSGSLIMSICATVGMPVITRMDACIHDGFVGFTKLRHSEQDFLYYKLKELEPAFKAMGQTGSQANLNSDLVRDCLVALPPLPEQRAIAGALGDVDALLGALTQLIAKKRDLKQAAMQQLLTGQTRLPGFSGEWEVKRLGEIGSWLSGGTPSMSDDSYWNGDIPWVSPKDMKVARLHDALDHVSDKALGSGARLAPRGAVLMVVRGMILAHSFPVARAERPLAFNQDIKALVVRAGIESDFVLYWLRANEMLLLSVANEATHGTKRIPSEALFATEFVVPPRREQTAIAAVLSDMDAELAGLEQRLAKTRALKQGMMQELLTGRTRLV